ncbi:MAG: sigma-70 family RNA polymerase sigma factor [Ruminococcaceae bacterium]|nr:sigma-70 family RNA polymerase sigma factor [Oscillospiraceae bacterium]
MLLSAGIGLLNYIFVLLGVTGGQHYPPPLPQREEEECFEKMKNGDEAARTKLIEHNLRLVAHIVRKYYMSAPNQEDLVSVGSIGLIKAIDSFDNSNGARFATYGAKCIQNEILMYFRSQKKLGCEVSINETIDMDKEGNPLTYIDVIAVDDTIAEDIDRKIHIANALKCIDTVLSERERTIIILRYGLGKWRARTQREVAELLGISRSYVSRIEKAALEKIKDNLKI